MNPKKFLIPLIFSTVLFLIWTVSLASAGVLEDIKSKGVLVVSTDANYAPQSFLNDKGELIGIEILNASTFIRDSVLDSAQAKMLQMIKVHYFKY